MIARRISESKEVVRDLVGARVRLDIMDAPVGELSDLSIMTLTYAETIELAAWLIRHAEGLERIKS